MTDDPMLNAAQIHACLRTVGVDLPVLPDPMPRAAAMGMLLYCVESAVTFDTDRLDLEAVREGYFAGIRDTLRVANDGSEALGGVWSRLLQARVNRTLTDLVATRIGDDGEGCTVPPAVNHLLDATQALLSTSNPPADTSPHEQLQGVRNALRTARREVQAPGSRSRTGARCCGPSGSNPDETSGAPLRCEGLSES
ncbi:hypothetical protein C8250_000550 [Streptomyces sp. So13.3]|uniref:hypothetical protein n=1 Tax=unclassified Streptomyces TaxID=2593676 RepID=UPI0011071CB6|nr:MULTISPECIES: hypothetical protein [unclassified Streptomyces]MCZ4103221.1 hypothetical protein [Streptomyces sp. H39-C1]QNA70647.1 hypothetical protein C8250_000550 [Streptomyces sp. So13.3]